MSPALRIACVGSFVLLLCAGAHAQPAAGQPQGPTFRSNVDLITVDLTVVDRDGAPISGLSTSDMTVLVDDTPRRVVSLIWLPPFGAPGASALAASRSMVFIVDPATMRPGQGMQLLHAAARYIDRLPASARVAVAVVPRIDTATRFDEPREVLKDRLLRGTGNGGREVPLEQNTQGLVQEVFDRLATVDGPKQVVLIEGTNHGNFNVPTQFTALDMLVSAVTAWRSRVVVNELELWNNPGWEAIAPEQGTAMTTAAFSPRPMTDRILSTATGGLAMAPVSGDSFFTRLEREQGGSYVIAFEPIDADRDGRAHEIKVKVTRPNTTIRARHEFSLERADPASRAPGFAAHLLSDLTIRLSVSVSDNGSRGALGHSFGGITCSDGGVGLAEAFPPLATYRFTSSVERGAELLTDGVHPTYYVRNLSRPGETPLASSCDISGPTSRDRIFNIAAMLRKESVPLHETELESVEWKGVDDLRRSVADARRRVESAYATLVELVRVDGLLNREDAARLRPEIRIELNDLRQDNSVPLPAIP